MAKQSKTMRRVVLAVCAAMLVSAVGVGVAVAQNWNLAPRYGTATLRGGFSPDPHTVTLTAGGPIRTSQGGCSAYVANNPDFRLNFTPGSLPLNIYVTSSTDTTLLINQPNGTWICNDDGGSGMNPLVSLNPPQAGQYDIFVGTYSQSNTQANLHISELSPRW